MYTVAALYKFSSVDDPNTLQNKIRKRFKQLKIYGTILVGKEGINGTISAEQKNLQKAFWRFFCSADMVPLIPSLPTKIVPYILSCLNLFLILF